MKTIVKAVLGILVITTVTIGVAPAMIPKDDLKKNLFPDVGISSRVLSDIDKEVHGVRAGIPDSSSSNSGDSSELLYQIHCQLKGKHLI